MLKILMLLCTGIASAAEPWGLNDVSFLFPIRDLNATAKLLKTSDAGDHGALIPAGILKKIGSLSASDPEGKSMPAVRAVSVRIDPCFASGPDLRSCRRQIRMVWQPVVRTPSGELTTHDTALHTFYDLSPEDFSALVADIASLRERSGARLSKLPLSVHPVMAREGLKGPFYSQLKRILLSYAGEATLSRVTFMKLAGGGAVWDFGGFEVSEGSLTRIEIAGLGKVRQIFINGAKVGEKEYFSSRTVPESTAHRNLNWISKDTHFIRKHPQPDLVIRDVIAARELQNPRIAPTERTDCVSCHVSQAAHLIAVRNFPELQLEDRYLEAVYRNDRYPLKSVGPASELTSNLRAFGYFGSIPSVSARVAHESAEVADALNGRAPFRVRRGGFRH